MIKLILSALIAFSLVGFAAPRAIAQPPAGSEGITLQPPAASGFDGGESGFLTITKPPMMPSGFYYPTMRTWTGDYGGSTGNPKQTWNDTSGGGRIYGYLEKRYESDIGTQHVGMDIRVPSYAPIYAICDGVIERMWKQVSNDPTYWALIVRHYASDGSPFWAIYGHCENLSSLPVGSSVKAGQQIATCKESPNWHCHFGINLDRTKMSTFGRIPIGTSPSAYGWTAPRAWLLAHRPKPSSTPMAQFSPSPLVIRSEYDKTRVQPGDVYTLTYTIKNDGAEAREGLSITAPVPEGAEVVDSSLPGTMDWASYVVPLPKLGAQSETNVTVTYHMR